MQKTKSVRIILYNLGGPDRLEAVRPFLFNLFYDPAIFRLPNPFRWLLAQLVSRRRQKKASGIYAQMGGKSPILEETLAQAARLEQLLAERSMSVSVRVAMRYWHPMAAEAVRSCIEDAVDEVILLPLYPHYSTTTTESFMKEWQHQALGQNAGFFTKMLCCYPTHSRFIDAHVALLHATLTGAQLQNTTELPMRILFSAHGLPQKVVDEGDPYQRHIEATVKALLMKLGQEVDYRITYQSRVGPLKWLEPSTEHSIKEAALDGVGIIIVPIAFVSEHSETKVELDIEYAELAHELGVKIYRRVPTLSTHPFYIEALADLATRVLSVSSDENQKVTVFRDAVACEGKWCGACRHQAPLV